MQLARCWTLPVGCGQLVYVARQPALARAARIAVLLGRVKCQTLTARIRSSVVNRSRFVRVRLHAFMHVLLILLSLICCILEVCIQYKVHVVTISFPASFDRPGDHRLLAVLDISVLGHPRSRMWPAAQQLHRLVSQPCHAVQLSFGHR